MRKWSFPHFRNISLYSKFRPKQRIKYPQFRSGHKAGQCEVFSWGIRGVKEGHPLSPLVEQNMERRGLQRLDPSQRVPVDLPYPIRDIPQSPGIWKTISQRRRKNPTLKYVFFKTRKHLWKGKLKQLESYTPKSWRNHFWFIFAPL